MGEFSPGNMVYNIPFLTGASERVPTDQLLMNLPAAQLRGGKGRREIVSFCTWHRTAPTCKLNVLIAIRSDVLGFLVSKGLPTVLMKHLQPTMVPHLFSQEASVFFSLRGDTRNPADIPHRNWQDGGEHALVSETDLGAHSC